MVRGDGRAAELRAHLPEVLPQWQTIAGAGLSGERGSMKWQSIVAGALASVFGTLFIAGTASADVRIVNDPGGEVSSYLRTFYEMRAITDSVTKFGEK
jgi:hypothetical protein